MECLSRNSSVLEVQTRQAQGAIYIEGGQIIHAEVGDRSGEEAFNYLMALAGGEFNLRPFTQPRTHSISAQWEFLLMEAARKRDENGEASEPEPSPSATLAPPSDPFAVPRTQFITRAADPKPEEYRPEIAEFLILSSQADVLYKWQCEEINGRINFLEFLSQRARQVAQGLPVGEFQRFEVYGSKSRAVVQVDTDHAFLVCTNLVSANGGAA